MGVAGYKPRPGSRPEPFRDGTTKSPPRWWRKKRFYIPIAILTVFASLSFALIVILVISAIRAPTNTIPHPGLIEDSITEGRYEDALTALDSLEELYSDRELDDDNTAWIEGHRGLVLLKQGRYAQGMDFLDRAISLDSTQADYYNWRALTFFRLGRMTDAEADFTRALNLESENYLWHLDRGYFYLDTGDLNLAVEDARTAINLAPLEPMGYGLRADAYAGLGRPEVALFDLDTLVDLTPGDWRPYLSRARVKNDLGNASGAIADLDAALDLGPTPEGLAQIDLIRATIGTGL